MRTAVVLATMAGVCAVAPAGRAAAQDATTFTLPGQIVDAFNEAPVIAAVIKVPELRRFVFSDVNGRFRFTDFPEGTWEIIVEQLGYHTLDGSVTVSEGDGLRLRMEPDPVALEEIKAGGLTYKTRLKRRRNRSRARSYALEGEALWASTKDNVWDLVGWRHGFHFEGFSDYGCALATIYGSKGTVDLYVNDRAVGIGVFEEYAPSDFALVEVYSYGRSIKAYTQPYLDRMTQERRPAVSVIPGLCPKESKTVYKRGRWVREPPGAGSEP